MNNNSEITTPPTFEQLPAMVAELLRKVDEFLNRTEKAKDIISPMGIALCADFLSSIEGRKVSTGAVYNRVHNGSIPYRKIGAHLFFYREDILAFINNAKIHQMNRRLIISQK
ncbi:MAG: helix-turn-helix domain-containing protein [Chlorobiaceae bacterium]